MDTDGDSSESDSFAESVSDEFFHDSVEGRKVNVELSNGENDDAENKNRSRPDLVLDLRNVPPIACTVKSDDETSEKLSAVIEQPEEHLVLDSTPEEVDEFHEDPNNVLRERIGTLREVMNDLHQRLRQETTLLRKERDEFQLLRERSDILALEEATAAARAAAEAYAAESPLSNEIGDVVDLNPVQSLSELTILEYEKKLAKYQDALALAQAEKRYNMRRQLIANTYQQRLLEVERLCNEEFEKIRENANSLRPLRHMASQWCVQDGDGIHSDAFRQIDSTVISYNKCEKKIPTDNSVLDEESCKIGNVDAEVNMLPEVVAARFSYAESLRYDRHAKTSQSHTLIESNSGPSNWYASSTNS